MMVYICRSCPSSAGLITATDEVTKVTDTRDLLILAAWRLGVPAVLVTTAAALTYHRTKA